METKHDDAELELQETMFGLVMQINLLKKQRLTNTVINEIEEEKEEQKNNDELQYNKCSSFHNNKKRW